MIEQFKCDHCHVWKAIDQVVYDSYDLLGKEVEMLVCKECQQNWYDEAMALADYS